MEARYPDIRIVNLYRKAIHVPDCMQDVNESLWLATDYFDAFEVQKIDIKRFRFGLIEAINARIPTIHDVATQSFPLVYEERDKPEGISCEAWGEPFDEDKNDYPFLSIIQAYITPEAFARNDINEKCSNSIPELVREYYADIYSIVKDFCDRNEDHQFKFKIYRSLSVGELTVVICSKKADIPYWISTAMRRRRAVLSDTGNKPTEAKDIVIYKTYTILSMHNSWIRDDLETGANNSHFILRCCYSNKYWSKRSLNDEELIKHESSISEKLNRLTGRYDFSVNLSDRRFGHIFEDLRQYKLDLSIEDGRGELFHRPDDSEYDEADYLHYLIKKQYLSHVNERFSFSFTEKGAVVPSESGIYLDSKKAVLDYTDRKNQAFLSKVKKKCEDTINKVRKIPGYHKNLDNNMRLLSRLIDICGTLNGLSDMRIYCTMVLKYLEVLLENLDHYCGWVIKNKRHELVSYMDSALGSMIYVLNAYVDYVRNNNLQSLQTPNYNIESNLSIEKYLIGYSGFIEELFECYKQAFDFLKGEWSANGGTRNLEPVVVPQAENDVLTVQVFFPRLDFADTDDVTRLMVVKCPTFSELTNVAEMTATLIHETAHRFRYEKRRERNTVIAQYIARRVFDGAAKEIMAEIQHEFQYLPSLEKRYWSLNNEMAKAYLKSFYSELFFEKEEGEPLVEGQKISEYSMRLLGRRMQDDYRAFVGADKCFNDFDIKLRRFLDTVGEKIDFSGKVAQKSISKVISFKDKYRQNGKINKKDAEKAFSKLFNETENAVKILFDKCSSKSAAAPESEAQKAFDSLLDCLSDFSKEKDHHYNARVIDRREQFYKDLYSSLCRDICLPTAEDKDGKIEMEMDVSRYLCIDFDSDGNRKVFTEIVERKIQSLLEPSIDLARRSVYAYRELTADLFMVKLLDFEPFGYLLVSARNLPMEHEPMELHLRRIADVLYVSWKASDKAGKGFENVWEEIIESLWEKSQVVICRMFEKHFGELLGKDKPLAVLNNANEILKVFISLKNGLKNKNTSGSSLQRIDEVIKAIEELRDIIEGIYISGKTDYLRHLLTEITTYCNVLKYLKALSLHGLRHIEELKIYDFLEEDLVEGCNKIQKMQETLFKGNLGEHFKAVRNYYNDPYGRSSDSDDSLEMLDFILFMFYKKKIQTAGEIITYDNGE